MLSSNQIKRSLRGLELEKKRDNAARESNYREFVSLYRKNLPSVPDINTANFWNNLLAENENLILKSPIFLNKIKIISKILLKEKGKVIDIGFGYGYLEDYLTSKKSKLILYGVDISAKAVSKSKLKFNGDVKEGVVTNIPFNNKLFDVAVALDVLEHISPNQLFRSLKEISRVLKNNGQFIVSVPLNEGLIDMVSKGNNPNGHVRAYTPSILNTELKLSGFSCEEVRFLYAYKNFYHFKSILAKFLLREPNLLIGIYRKTA